jgi:hypothetical protein
MKILKQIHTRTLLSLALMTVMAWAMSSCRSGRNVTTVAPETEYQTWHDVYMPVKVNLKSPSSLSLSGRATMVRDSVINISFRVLGFEVAVANVTNDSVWLVDKYHKYLFAEPLSAITGGHNLSVGDIQQLLMRRAALGDVLSFDNSRLEQPVTIKYADPVESVFGSYYSDIAVSAALTNMEVSAVLDWSLSSAKWNENRSASFVQPDGGYKRITATAVAAMLKSLTQ